MKLSLIRALEYIDVDEYVQHFFAQAQILGGGFDETIRKRSEKSRVLKYISE